MVPASGFFDRQLRRSGLLDPIVKERADVAGGFFRGHPVVRWIYHSIFGRSDFTVPLPPAHQQHRSGGTGGRWVPRGICLAKDHVSGTTQLWQTVKLVLVLGNTRTRMHCIAVNQDRLSLVNGRYVFRVACRARLAYKRTDVGNEPEVDADCGGLFHRSW